MFKMVEYDGGSIEYDIFFSRIKGSFDLYKYFGVNRSMIFDFFDREWANDHYHIVKSI